MTKITMTSVVLEIVEIKNKTKAKFFKDVEVGDKLCFSVDMEHSGSASGGGVYATYVKVENLSKGTYAYKSQSEMVNILSRLFELRRTELDGKM
ncbi:hypothetical protein [Brevibacillus laterosporus]|uniref:hypothetical protein n=1 Tax=Brevibacillus laterosporus TaxID=1465 RepID=UPI003D2606E4